MINLLKVGLYACGTLRADRKGFPIDLKQMAKKGSKTKGDCKTRQYDNVTVSVWQDTKPVLVTATNSDPTGSAQEPIKRRSVQLHSKAFPICCQSGQSCFFQIWVVLSGCKINCGFTYGKLNNMYNHSLFYNHSTLPIFGRNKTGHFDNRWEMLYYVVGGAFS